MSEDNKSDHQPVDVEKFVARYVKLRDAIRKKKEGHTAELKPFNEAMAATEAVLLSVLQGNNARNMRTGAGTVSVLDKWSAVVDDPVAFRSFCVQQNMLDLADIKANAPAVLEYNNSNGKLPPGVRLSSFKKIGVLRASGGEK